MINADVIQSISSVTLLIHYNANVHESVKALIRIIAPETMPFEHIQDSRGPSRHGRSRSDKGSSDSLKTRGPKPPSQKAMLSKALQKANAAVQLDNGQDVWGAREAYGEACELLQQVLQRTSAQEDKRKLEAIVSVQSRFMHICESCHQTNITSSD